jgi:hypothetical protein
MLEKLLGVRSWGGFIGHLAHRETTLPTSLGGFDLPSINWIVAPPFLGYWALALPRVNV